MNKIVATIGFFDGVHRGHQYLIQQVREEADAIKGQSLIVTMNPHPRMVLQPGFEPELLTTVNEKLDMLRASGANKVEILHFDREMSCLTAREFMQRVLKKNFQVGTLVMGYDHHFGHDGGTFEEYYQWGKECGIEVVLAHELKGRHVSSSVIRKMLKAGNTEEASELLGRPYEIRGQVVSGHHVGRTMGFPTANLIPEPMKLIPKCGVYAVWVILPDGTHQKGMLNIGRRPTIDNGNDITIEVNLLHFIGDLYQSSLNLQVIHRLRDERKFDSVEELQHQLSMDAQVTDKLLG